VLFVSFVVARLKRYFITANVDDAAVAWSYLVFNLKKKQSLTDRASAAHTN